MEQVAAERIELARDAVAGCWFEAERSQCIVMEAKDEFGFDARAEVLPIREKLRDGEKFVGHAFHCGNYDDHIGIFGDRLDEFGGDRLREG